MAIERITGIVTGIVRHSDRQNVVTLYTRERGRISLMSATGTGRAARLRNARLQPLAVISADVNFKLNRELQSLGAFAPANVWHDIYFNPAKGAVAMFLAEFLNAFLRQSQTDPAMWDFIYRSILDLDRTRRNVANRHIAFLAGLLSHAGILPDLSVPPHSSGMLYFDMREGVISAGIPLHKDILGPDAIPFILQLSRISAANCHKFRFTPAQRRSCLLALIHYYAVHYPGLSNLKTPDILADTFA